MKGKAKAPRKTLLIKLVIAFVIPTMSLFSLFAFFSYQVQREDLEAELGKRLQDVASAAAISLRGKYLVDLQAGEEEESLHYANGMRRLQRVQKATGVDRIYVFDSQFTIRLDTGGLPIGETQFQVEIDRQELSELFVDGLPRSSLLFDGMDGRPYKTGYAALVRSDTSPEIVLAIGVDAPAEFFLQLRELQSKLILYGLALVLAVAGIAVLVGLRITRPIRSLALAAERIGLGDLREPIAPSSRDEIGLLAITMETMRSELRNRDERMQRMLAGIAHEVRNPLGGMELFCGILREELEDDAEKYSHVCRIDKEIGHLKVVVESFLEYARRPSPVQEPVALAPMLAEVVELEEPLAHTLSVPLQLQADDIWCVGDSQQLRRAMLNLIVNAIEAASTGKEPVVIKAWQQQSEVHISVHNHGEAISKETLERLFEPFYTTKQKGTGLGLAFVDEIVRDHGGRIEVSSSEELGTEFVIILQAQRSPEEGRDKAQLS